jgi:hypothetical protein
MPEIRMTPTEMLGINKNIVANRARRAGQLAKKFGSPTISQSAKIRVTTDLRDKKTGLFNLAGVGTVIAHLDGDRDCYIAIKSNDVNVVLSSQHVQIDPELLEQTDRLKVGNRITFYARALFTERLTFYISVLSVSPNAALGSDELQLFLEEEPSSDSADTEALTRLSRYTVAAKNDEIVFELAPVS